MDEENTTTTQQATSNDNDPDKNMYLPYGKYTLSNPIEVSLPTSTPSFNQPGNTSTAPDSYISGDVSVSAVGYKNGNTYWKVEYTTSAGSQLYAWVDATNFNQSTKDNGGVLNSTDDYVTLSAAAHEAENIDAERTGRENELTLQRLSNEAKSYDYLVEQYIVTDKEGMAITVGDVTYKVSDYIPRDISGLDIYLRKMTRIFGLPPQWSPYADVRIGASGSLYNFDAGIITLQVKSGDMMVGRRYAETILGCPTILAMCPGRLVPSKGMNQDFSDMMNDAAALTNAFKSGEAEPFWKFEENWNNTASTGGAYVNCCNVLCRYAAICLSVSDDPSPSNMANGGEIKLADKKAPWGGTYANMSVEQFLDPGSGSYSLSSGGGLSGVLQHYLEMSSNLQRKFVYFNANGGITVSDEFNTETRQSVLEQMINGGISSTMKDIAFMVGDQVVGTEVQSDLDSLKELATSSLGGTVGSLVSAATEIIHGGVIAFPQIIDSCTWGRTFTFTVKFSSMYGDVESRFLNVIMPYLCLASFFLPRQLKNTVDMYTYPPVVRAFARGVYACDCGVVTGVSAKRGGEDDSAWTASGQPMEIDVTFSIKALHQNLMQSDSELWFYKNTGMQMYIGTLCGIDMTMQQSELIKATIDAFASHIFQDIKRDVIYGINHDIQMNVINQWSLNRLEW